MQPSEWRHTTFFHQMQCKVSREKVELCMLCMSKSRARPWLSAKSAIKTGGGVLLRGLSIEE
jgi:hypothetical protein